MNWLEKYDDEQIHFIFAVIDKHLRVSREIDEDKLWVCRCLLCKKSISILYEVGWNHLCTEHLDIVTLEGLAL